VTPGEAVRHGLLLAGRNVAKTLRSPEQLGDFTLQPVIFVLLFTYLFGGAIAGDWRHYLQYVLPGIMVQTALMGTMWTGVGLATDIKTGIFDRFRSLPIARPAPLVGAVLGDMVRFVVGCVVILGFGMVLGFRVRTDPLSALAAVLLVLAVAFALCWVSVLVGVLAKGPESVGPYAFLGIMPLTFASSAFVRPATMPSFLRAVVRNNPASQLCDTVRGLMLGGPVGQHLLVTLAWTVGIVAVFAPLATRAFLRRT
jgi:oleandomycin transport system permease protein